MKALITGVNGQDGSYLAELLISKGYSVHGVVRRYWEGWDNFPLIKHLEGKITLHQGDMADTDSIRKLVETIEPDEIYNLGAQTHITESFMTPTLTTDVNYNGVLRLLEAIRQVNPAIRLYQASTSELFGNNENAPQNEDSVLMPASPYSIAKLAAHHAIRVYRESYGLFACAGILFNHESPRRSPVYVTRKITLAVANIAKGKQDKLKLGSLDAGRDWGYAKEYVELMWQMLQQEKPKDYVIGTGESHTVKEWLDEAFRLVGLESSKYVEFDPTFKRVNEVAILRADYSKAKTELGFEPKTKFKELVKLMVEADLAL